MNKYCRWNIREDRRFGQEDRQECGKCDGHECGQDMMMGRRMDRKVTGRVGRRVDRQV